MDWLPAIEADRHLRDGAQIAENTHLVDLSGYPPRHRMIVRRERPHPGAQLSLFDSIEGLRRQVFITPTPHSHCSVQRLQAWRQLALLGIDLLAWTRTLLLDSENALAEPKKLR